MITLIASITRWSVTPLIPQIARVNPFWFHVISGASSNNYLVCLEDGSWNERAFYGWLGCSSECLVNLLAFVDLRTSRSCSSPLANHPLFIVLPLVLRLGHQRGANVFVWWMTPAFSKGKALCTCWAMCRFDIRSGGLQAVQVQSFKLSRQPPLEESRLMILSWMKSRPSFNLCVFCVKLIIQTKREGKNAKALTS